MEQNLFELHYQPQYLLNGQLTGFEALLRLRNAEGIYVDPGELIATAEETGLIVPIGAWVLREACRQLREWLDEGLEETRIAINVSAMQISRPLFADEILGILSQTGIKPQLLEFELTESAMMRNLEESKRQIQKLTKLGTRIAIGRFGTAHSSLVCLLDLPVDVLKIDSSFIERISSPSGLSMLKGILALASNLQLEVVAVGIETEKQLAALRDCRCDVLQGYLFGHPQNAANARLILDKQEVSWETEEQLPVG